MRLLIDYATLQPVLFWFLRLAVNAAQAQQVNWLKRSMRRSAARVP